MVQTGCRVKIEIRIILILQDFSRPTLRNNKLVKINTDGDPSRASDAAASHVTTRSYVTPDARNPSSQSPARSGTLKDPLSDRDLYLILPYAIVMHSM